MRPLISGESRVATVAVFAAGVVLAGLIIWIVLGRIQRLQRDQRRALHEREQQARVFGS